MAIGRGQQVNKPERGIKISRKGSISTMSQEIIVFALTSSINLADEICEHLEVKRGKCKVNTFFLMEKFLVEPGESVRGKMSNQQTRQQVQQ